MKFVILLCLLLAIADAEEEECSQESVDSCIEGMLITLLGDEEQDATGEEEGAITDEEVCNELRKTTDCLRSKTDACTADMKDEEVEDIEKGLQGLENLLKENCEESGNRDDGDDDDAQVAMCLTENEDYIHECVGITTEDLISQVLQNDRLDQNSFTCSMYRKLGSCFVDRIREKCGQEAGDVAEVEFKDLPEEIAEACEGANDDNIDFSDALLEAFDKKKK